MANVTFRRGSRTEAANLRPHWVSGQHGGEVPLPSRPGTGNGTPVRTGASSAALEGQSWLTTPLAGGAGTKPQTPSCLYRPCFKR